MVYENKYWRKRYFLFGLVEDTDNLIGFWNTFYRKTILFVGDVTFEIGDANGRHSNKPHIQHNSINRHIISV